MSIHQEPVAIIGLGAMFPGAHSPEQFYRNLLSQRCFIRDVPEWLWERDVFLDCSREDPNSSYSHVAALVADPDFSFDDLRIPPMVVSHMSRAQKLALTCARQTFQDAGFDLASGLDRSKVSVFISAIAGGELSEVISQSIAERRIFARLEALADQMPAAEHLADVLQAYRKANPAYQFTEDTLPGNSTNLVAGRIASAFDFKGINATLDAACASSLLAINTAIRSLQSGESDFALAGGVDTWIDASAFISFSRITALSKDGCYPFDERADGLALGEGCGTVLLQRLSDALAQGNRIHAVIAGIGSSSDGAGLGITSPAIEGQVLAVQRALAMAEMDPGAYEYIECHGTATRLGDPTELESVRRIWSDRNSGSADILPVGSVKASVGHMRTAAGMGGLMNAVGIIRNGVIPGQVNFEHPTTAFDWERSGLRIADQNLTLSGDERCIGVSGFGFGGINSHMVLRSPPAECRKNPRKRTIVTRPDSLGLAGDVAWLFPGQGSQSINMGAEMRETEIGLSLWKTVDEIVGDMTGTRLSDVVYPDTESPEAEKALRRTQFAQPALLTVSVIMGRTLFDSGFSCNLMMGHSLGEYSALVLAGALGFEDAVRAVTKRGLLISAGPNGQLPSTMAYLIGDHDRIEGLCKTFDRIEIANVNSYEQIVIAGPVDDVAAVAAEAGRMGIQFGQLNVDRAFHSIFVSHAVEPMQDVLQPIAFQYPFVPVTANTGRHLYPWNEDLSNAGRPLSPSDKTTLVRILSEQIARPVHFASQVEWAYASGIRRFVEVGPGRVLSGLVDSMFQGKPFAVASCEDSDTQIISTMADPLTTSRRTLRGVRKPVFGLVVEDEIDMNSLAPEDYIRHVVAKVSGYAPRDIDPTARFDRDLGLDSLKMVEIVMMLRGKYLPEGTLGFRHLNSIQAILESAEAVAPAAPQKEVGINVHYNEFIPVEEHDLVAPDVGPWAVHVPERLFAALSGLRLAGRLSRHMLYVVDIGGPEMLSQELLPTIHEVFVHRHTDLRRFALITVGEPSDLWLRSLTGFMRSLAMECPNIQCSFHQIETGDLTGDVLQHCLSDISIGKRLSPNGTWTSAEMSQVTLPAVSAGDLPKFLDETDVILVTGGARGIAAEMVKSLLAVVQSRFIVLGSKPKTEAWITKHGENRVRYIAADLGNQAEIDALQLKDAGITFVIHAAGLSYLTPLKDKPVAELNRLMAVKALSIRNLIGQLANPKLKGLVNVSSIVGHFGNLAQSDYAAANGFLDGLEVSGSKVLSLQWGPWGEVGMASRGVTSAVLDASGIQRISTADGVRLFKECLTWWLSRGEQRNTNTVLSIYGDLGVSLAGPGPQAVALPEQDPSAARSEAASPTYFMICGIFGYGYRLQLVVEEMVGDVSCLILEPPDMNWSHNGCESLQDMAAWYCDRIEAEQPDGPISLVGTSFGGNMAYEVACALQAKGRNVERLILVDAMPFEEDPLENNALEDVILHQAASENDLIQIGARVAAQHLKAFKAHTPTLMFQGRIDFLLAIERGVPALTDRRLLWNKRASEGMRLIPVEMQHGQFAKPDVRPLVADMLDRLSTSEAKVPDLQLNSERAPEQIEKREGIGGIIQFGRFKSRSWMRVWVDRQASRDWDRVALVYQGDILLSKDLAACLHHQDDLRLEFELGLDLFLLDMPDGAELSLLGFTHHGAVEFATVHVAANASPTASREPQTKSETRNKALGMILCPFRA